MLWSGLPRACRTRVDGGGRAAFEEHRRPHLAADVRDNLGIGTEPHQAFQRLFREVIRQVTQRGQSTAPSRPLMSLGTSIICLAG